MLDEWIRDCVGIEVEYRELFGDLHDRPETGGDTVRERLAEQGWAPV